MDYVTDDRNPEYWRPYVGQASDPAIRISQHLNASEKNRNNTLNYYIVSEGEGFRAMNYIRLWSLSHSITIDGSTNESRTLLNNILETVMCCAFQPLPSSEVGRVLGKGDFATTGLNILPPLLQGIKLDIPARVERIKKCSNSIDEQIRRWPQERKRQRDQSRSSPTGKSFERYWKPSDYRDALDQAIERIERCKNLALDTAQSTNGPSIADIPSLLEEATSKLQVPDSNDLESFNPSWARPYGTLEAQAGVLLGQCPVNRSDNKGNIQENMTALPSALLDANFSASNSLIWTYNLRQPFQPRPNSSKVVERMDPDEQKVLSGFHRALIAGSNLKVILLSGRDVENTIMSPELAGNRTTLILRGYRFPAFLETDKDKTKVVRVYVRLQSSLAITSRCDSWEETKEHAEAFRFAAIVTATPDIYGFVIATSLISKEIILRYWAEREGFYEPMTIKCMDPKVREWFTLKGITLDSEIELFERLGGTLIRGAFLLLMVLPQCPLNRTKKKSPALRRDSKKPNGVQQVFAKEKLGEARSLYAKFTGFGDRTATEELPDPKASSILAVEGVEELSFEPDEELDEILPYAAGLQRTFRGSGP